MNPEGARPRGAPRGLAPFAFTLLLCVPFLSTVVAEAPPASPLTTEAKDTNGDGKPDLWITREGNRPVRIERDRNGDGKPDVWAVYTYPAKGHSRLVVAVDRNYDGRPDYWREEIDHWPTREWGDLNFDGRVDIWTFYAPNSRAKQWVVMDKNYDGRPDAWFHYGADGTHPDAGEVDEHFDGKPRVFSTLPKERPTLDDPPVLDLKGSDPKGSDPF